MQEKNYMRRHSVAKNDEWIAEFCSHEAKLVARIPQRGGGDELVAVSELVRRGIPITKSIRHTIETNFSEWETTPTAVAKKLFGIGSSHLVWQYRSATQMNYVPAVVLLRAFSRLQPTLMEAFFKLQGMDSVVVSHENGHFKLNPRIKARAAYQLRKFNQLLSWLTSYPSARRMLGSLLQNASEGKMRFELPDANARLNMGGVACEGGRLVTIMSLMELQPLERPFAFATGDGEDPQAWMKVAVGFERTSTKKAAIMKVTQLPLREGDYKMSDDEWAEVQRVVRKAVVRFKLKYSIRELLDLLLCRACLSTSMNATPYPRKMQAAAQSRLIRWKDDGTWERVCETIRRLRGGEEPLSDSPEGPASYQELSDEEWSAVEHLLKARSNSSKHPPRNLLNIALARQQRVDLRERGYSRTEYDLTPQRVQRWQQQGYWKEAAKTLRAMGRSVQD